MPDNRREQLEPYLDKRIRITGVFWRLDKRIINLNRIKTVADVQDVLAEHQGQEIDVGHAWVQHADCFGTLQLKPGDRIACTCRVHRYQQLVDRRTVTKYGLSYPDNVTVLNRIPALAIPSAVDVARVNRPPVVDAPCATTPLVSETPGVPPTKPDPDPDPLDLLVRLKELRKLAGSWGRVEQMIAVLRD